MKKPFCVAFNLTEEEFDELNFKDLNDYADVIYSETFEGVQKRYNFTEYEYFTVNSM